MKDTKDETKPKRPRGTGSIYRRKDSGVWWIKYSRNGKPFWESTKETNEKKAETYLKNRLAEIQTGTFIGPKREKIRVEELADDFLRDYRINGKKSIADVTARWELHLKPFFKGYRAVDVTSEAIKKYVDSRLEENAKNATINRELAALKRMFHIGQKSTPPKVLHIPAFPHLTENNVRKGFLEDGQYQKLIQYCPELWFRTLVEIGRTYGWRISELLKLRVEQIDLKHRVIRLDVGTTKNSEGREVLMTNAVYNLLEASIADKKAHHHVFTRPNGKPVKDFKQTWYRACDSAGLGKIFCRKCSKQTHSRVCENLNENGKKCGCSEYRYKGLIFHDFRRTAARNLRRAGVAEGVIMKIGGWKTRSVFERYNIVSQSDISDALLKLEQSEQEREQAKAPVKSGEDQQGLDGDVSVTFKPLPKPTSGVATPKRVH